MDKKQLKKIFIEIIIGLIGVLIGCVITHYFTLQEIDYEHSLTETDDLSAEDLLLKADNYYKLGEYVRVVEIYNNEKLQDCAFALNNLASLYVKGIGVAQDIGKAKELYYKAYKLDENYLGGYIAVNVIYPENLNEINTLIKQGLEENESGTVRFIKAILYSQYPGYGFDESTFVEQTNEWQIQVLQNDLSTSYEWEKDYVEENDFLEYIGKDFERKEQIGTFLSETEEVRPLYGTVTYKLYRVKEFTNATCLEGNMDFQALEEQAG